MQQDYGYRYAVTVTVQKVIIGGKTTVFVGDPLDQHVLFVTADEEDANDAFMKASELSFTPVEQVVRYK